MSVWAGLVLGGYSGPPELTAARGLTTWTLDPGGAVLAVALAVPYALGVRRVQRSGGRWPVARTVAYALGLAGVLVATFSFLGAYSHVLFWVTSVQVAILLTVVPVLLVLGAPLRLLGAAVPGAAQSADRVLAAPPARLLTFPLVGAALVAVVPFLVYFTPVFEASLRSALVYWLLHVVLVAAGLVFFWPVLSVDRDSRLPYAAVVVVVLVETLVDSVPGIVLWLGTGLVAGGYYRELARPWGRSLLSDQQFGGVMLWAVGEGVGVPLLLLVAVQWMRADAREAARIDRELDLAEEARRSAQATE